MNEVGRYDRASGVRDHNTKPQSSVRRLPALLLYQ